MPTILPLTVSTVLAQFVAGVAFMLVWRSFRLGMPLMPVKSSLSADKALRKNSKKNASKLGVPAPVEMAPHASMTQSWLVVAGAAVIALLMTMIQPSPPHTSGLAAADPLWMRPPSLLLVLTAAFAFLTWQNKGLAALGLLAALCGWAALLLQALMFTPTALDSLSGLLPLTMFALGAFAIGAAHIQILEYRASLKQTAPDHNPVVPRAASVAVTMLQSALWPLLVIVALVPSLGASGDPIMRQVALMWMETLPYWAGVMATGVALGVSYMGPGTSFIQWVLVLVSLFCTRFAFFSDGIHFSAILLF